MSLSFIGLLFAHLVLAEAFLFDTTSVLRCASHYCTGSTGYCELYISSLSLHGSCVSVATAHHYPRCHGQTDPGTRCYCSSQSCIDSTEKAYKAAKTHQLHCHSHTCTDARHYCELYINSGGLQGSCVDAVAAHHYSRCHGVADAGTHCYCLSQSCIDSIEKAYNEGTKTVDSHNLNCHGHTCNITRHSYCMLSYYSDKAGKSHCGSNIHGKDPCIARDGTASVPLTENHDFCYCNTQECIDNFIIKAHLKDSHVRCGHSSCLVHDKGEVCVLTNLGHVHSYNGHLSQVDERCGKMDGANSDIALCTSTPEKGKSCACANQLCVNNFSYTQPSTTALPVTTPPHHRTQECRNSSSFIHCEHYQSGLHMCESTNAVVHDVAVGRCAEYCYYCEGKTTTSLPTTHPTTTSQPTTIQTTTVQLTTTTATTTTATTTTVTTTTPAPTSPREYPSCVGIQCNLYAPYCQLLEINSFVTGRCIPFRVGSECNDWTQVKGSGCFCSTTSCTVQMVLDHSDHVSHPPTTEQSTTTTTTTATTTQHGYNCNGHICTEDLKYCHLFEYLNKLEARCMPFSTGTQCRSNADLAGNGCTCTSISCSAAMVTTFHMHQETTTMKTDAPTTSVVTTSKPGLDCFGTTCSENDVCRVYLVDGTTYSGYCVPKDIDDLLLCKETDVTLSSECDCTTKNCIDLFKSMKESSTSHQDDSTSTISTTPIVAMTTADPCADKPGVDCQILNATNICALPVSHEYCAHFCGHCTAKLLGPPMFG